MKKRVRALLPFLLGAAYGLLLILLTFWLITGAADVVAFAAQMLRLEAAAGWLEISVANCAVSGYNS